MATILYQIPGDLSAGPLGRAELERRQGLLRRWASPSSNVDVADAPGGRCRSRATRGAPVGGPDDPRAAGAPGPAGRDHRRVFRRSRRPGLREIFESVVVGPFEASFHLAAQLGRRVGVVTVLDSVVPLLDHLVRGMGQSLNYAGAVAVQVSVLDLAAERDTLAARVALWHGRSSTTAGPTCWCSACMSMAFSRHCRRRRAPGRCAGDQPGPRRACHGGGLDRSGRVAEPEGVPETAEGRFGLDGRG